MILDTIAEEIANVTVTIQILTTKIFYCIDTVLWRIAHEAQYLLNDAESKHDKRFNQTDPIKETKVEGLNSSNNW